MSETTGRKVAGIAGKTLKLRQLRCEIPKSRILLDGFDGLAPIGKKHVKLTWGDVLAMAGSCANQAPDKSPARNRKRGSK